MPNNNDNNLRDFAKKELQRHGISDRESLYDPETNRTIPSVTTGVLPYYRAAQVAPLKAKSRSTGGYTAEGTPQRGGKHGAKHMGLSEYKALKSHGADAVLSDLKLIHSNKNNEFWNKVKAGQTPSIPETPEVYKKFRDLIRASGVNLREDEEGDHIYAMTNQNARDITGNRKIRKPSTYDMKGRPIKDGLMDPETSSGKFGYIELPEPMLNPIMENPVRKILGMGQKEFNQVIRGETNQSLQDRLKNLDVDTEMQRAKKNMSSKSRDKRDRAYTKYQYLDAMKKNNTRPENFMLDRVPVLPSEWRQMTEMKNKGTIVPDPNRLYRDLMFKIDDYKDSKEHPELMPEAREQLYDSFRAAVGTAQPQSPKLKEDNVRGMLAQFLSKGSPKASMIQRRVIGSDIDLYGLGVITPDPKLNMNQAGIPEEQAWKVYEPFTIRNLTKSGLSPRKATEEVENRTTRAKNALRQEVESRPALLNRAPTLHKYGVQAFKGKMVPGSAIRTNPYVMSSFGGDFDGDQCVNAVYMLLDHDLLAKYRSEGYITFHGEHITPEELENMKVESSELKEIVMASRQEKVPMYKDGEVFVVNLKDFPYDPENHLGSKDHIDFYGVPQGVKVIAYDETTSQPVWADVHGWSYHKQREIWTVNLKNKHQLITDDDPRAVYGLESGTLNFVRNCPENAVGMLVPVTKSLEHMRECEQTINSLDISDNNNNSGRASKVKDLINLNSETGYYLGAMAGDGWVVSTRGNPVTLYLSGIEEPVVNKIQRVSSLFMKDKILEWKEYSQYGSYGESNSWRCACSPLARFTLKCIGKKSTGKHLPRFWHKSPREFKIGLLSGLLDTDGSICISHGKKKPQLAANITSNSVDLLQDAQHMLRSLGIHSRLSFAKMTSVGNESWNLGISAAGLYDIKDELVCVKDKILESLNGEVVPDTESGAYVKNDLVPITSNICLYLKTLIRETLPYETFWSKREQKYQKRKKCTGVNGILTALYNGQRSGYTTRSTAKKAAEYIPEEEKEDFRQWLDIIYNEDITWSPVESVENTGKKEDGYDLTVPGFETFMSRDGIILSNTMSLSTPATQQATQEAWDKMLPSQNLIDPKGKPVYTPDNEMIQGLHLMTKPPDDNRAPIKTDKQNASRTAKKAYQLHGVDIDSPVIGADPEKTQGNKQSS